MKQLIKAMMEPIMRIGRFLDTPSEKADNILLGILVVLVLVAVFIGKMLLMTGPAAFGG